MPADVTVLVCHGYSQRQTPPHRSPSSLQLDAGNPSLQDDGLRYSNTPESPVNTGYLLQPSCYLEGKKTNILLPEMYIQDNIYCYYHIMQFCIVAQHNKYQIHQHLCANIFKKRTLFDHICNFNNIFSCSNNILCFECKDRIVSM